MQNPLGEPNIIIGYKMPLRRKLEECSPYCINLPLKVQPVTTQNVVFNCHSGIETTGLSIVSTDHVLSCGSQPHTFHDTSLLFPTISVQIKSGVYYIPFSMQFIQLIDTSPRFVMLGSKYRVSVAGFARDGISNDPCLETIYDHAMYYWGVFG